MSATNWLPSKESSLIQMCQQWMELFDNAEVVIAFKWIMALILPARAAITKWLEAFATYHAVDTSVNRRAKDRAKKEAMKAMRLFANSSIRYNPFMTEAEKQRMGVQTVRKAPTPVGKPEGLVVVSFAHPYSGSLLATFSHKEDTPCDKRANAGIYIAYDVFPLSDPIPDSYRMLRRTMFIRRKKQLFHFNWSDIGRRAVFCMRYENRKGDVGEWGPIMHTIIT